MQDYVIGLENLNLNDIDRVGGKNASLGEMLQNLGRQGVAVPGGFATTAQAYTEFLAQNQLDKRIYSLLDSLDINDVAALVDMGNKIRQWIIATPLPIALEQAIIHAYNQLLTEVEGEFSLAVRSSATAEDLPNASFAGQQETYLNVSDLDTLLMTVKQVFASLFNDRAISYRVHHGFQHRQVALSAGVQLMVRSDLAASGVMFTLDTESGFDQAIFITSSYGLGEMVVQGAVNPDEFYVHKPALAAARPAILSRHLGSKQSQMVYSTDNSNNQLVDIIPVEQAKQKQFSINDQEIEKLANYALIIEQHYQAPMDIEWAKDGRSGRLYIVQARPETVQSRKKPGLERYVLTEKSKVLVQGRSIGQKIATGTAKIIASAQAMDQISPGDVLITDMTDPDWEPVMKKASAIVTNRGGRTCHAAIIARELGIPAIVGCGQATTAIANQQAITVSCAEGDIGCVYQGKLAFDFQQIELDNMPVSPIKIMLNLANPSRAFAFSKLPNQGVGLARLEFIINNSIGIHPKALLEFDSLPNELKTQILAKTQAYASPIQFYIQRLTEGIASIAAAFAPKPVIVRLSDFKSNEYAHLLAGQAYEPKEENPMLGFRGAARYISAEFQACFALECQALAYVRNNMGLTNVQLMVPFVRTVSEAEQVLALLAQHGLKRAQNQLKIMMMCEIPANVILANEFLTLFDGFSIGSNDLTQLTLGLDRDSALVAEQFDERNPAVKHLLSQVIKTCKQQNKYIGICGQGPSDYPDFALWLLEQGIETLSLNPDSVIKTWLYLAEQQH